MRTNAITNLKIKKIAKIVIILITFKANLESLFIYLY